MMGYMISHVHPGQFVILSATVYGSVNCVQGDWSVYPAAACVSIMESTHTFVVFDGKGTTFLGGEKCQRWRERVQCKGISSHWFVCHCTSQLGVSHDSTQCILTLTMRQA